MSGVPIDGGLSAPTPHANQRARSTKKARARWSRRLRDLHGWLSALAFVLLMFFAATGLLLNHPDWFADRAQALPEQVFHLPTPVLAQVQADGRQVLTFTGYSAAGYEDEAAMLALAPAPGGVKVTCPPLTGSLLAELTETLKGSAKAEPAAAVWLSPLLVASVKPRDSNAPMSTLELNLRANPR